MKTTIVLALLLAGCSASPAATSNAATATEADAQAAYDAQQWPKCTAMYAALAERATGRRQEQSFYNAACCAARDGKADGAFALLERAAGAGLKDVDQTRADKDLARLHDDARWTPLLAKIENNEKAWESTFPEPALLHELVAMFREDQRVRNEDTGTPAGAAAVDAVDAKNTARMKQIIAAKGWPGKKLVGLFGAQAAWTLVQHADADVAFQKACLPLLEKAAGSGDARPADYAYLYDRVAVNEKRPQRYGTQMGDGAVPQPIEDPANVDARRKSVGLGPLAEYVEHMRKAAAK